VPARTHMQSTCAQGCAQAPVRTQAAVAEVEAHGGQAEARQLHLDAHCEGAVARAHAVARDAARDLLCSRRIPVRAQSSPAHIHDALSSGQQGLPRESRSRKHERRQLVGMHVSTPSMVRSCRHWHSGSVSRCDETRARPMFVSFVMCVCVERRRYFSASGSSTWTWPTPPGGLRPSKSRSRSSRYRRESYRCGGDDTHAHHKHQISSGAD